MVEALEQIVVTGPQGEVRMDPKTHHAQVNSYLARCERTGVFTIIKNFGPTPPVIPERYRERSQAARLHESPTSPQVAARIAAETAATLQRLGTARQILAVADMAILATDAEGIIVETNPRACDLFGYPPEELIGLSVHMLLPPHVRARHAEQLTAFVAGEQHERRMSSGREVIGYRKDGSFFPLEASIAKFRNEQGWHLVVTMRDISDRKRVEDELVWRATHDPLTDLPNRTLIRDRIGHALQRSRRQGQGVALLFIDLDGFKLINNSYSHEAGDMMLKTVASRLVAQVRPGDTVARLNGDEFVILCEHIEQPALIAALAERLAETLRQPVAFGEGELVITASIGVSVGHGATHAPDDLLRAADTAMYAVKQRGRDGWRFFSDSLQEQVRQRLTITQGLRLAVERGELSARFQPILAVATGHIVGAELLLRWHPPGGEISPAVFIPIAEMTGTIVAIGAWVFREACRAQADWQRRWGEAAPYVAVNLSARQLDEAALDQEWARILVETGAEPSRLLLEVTETALMADVETNLWVLRRLAELGLRVAVDDFGTGYSSLAQLTRLPVSVLKIDRAFVDGIDKGENSRAVIRAVIGLGRALGLKMVAEGVETAAQLAELDAYGCDFAQGYYFYRPLLEADFVAAYASRLSAGTS